MIELLVVLLPFSTLLGLVTGFAMAKLVTRWFFDAEAIVWKGGEPRRAGHYLVTPERVGRDAEPSICMAWFGDGAWELESRVVSWAESPKGSRASL